jgi:hypothetical protein
MVVGQSSEPSFAASVPQLLNVLLVIAALGRPVRQVQRAAAAARAGAHRGRPPLEPSSARRPVSRGGNLTLALVPRRRCAGAQVRGNAAFARQCRPQPRAPPAHVDQLAAGEA